MRFLNTRPAAKTSLKGRITPLVLPQPALPRAQAIAHNCYFPANWRDLVVNSNRSRCIMLLWEWGGGEKSTYRNADQSVTSLPDTTVYHERSTIEKTMMMNVPWESIKRTLFHFCFASMDRTLQSEARAHVVEKHRQDKFLYYHVDYHRQYYSAYFCWFGMFIWVVGAYSRLRTNWKSLSTNRRPSANYRCSQPWIYVVYLYHQTRSFVQTSDICTTYAGV